MQWRSKPLCDLNTIFILHQRKRRVVLHHYLARTLRKVPLFQRASLSSAARACLKFLHLHSCEYLLLTKKSQGVVVIKPARIQLWVATWLSYKVQRHEHAAGRSIFEWQNSKLSPPHSLSSHSWVYYWEIKVRPGDLTFTFPALCFMQSNSAISICMYICIHTINTIHSLHASCNQWSKNLKQAWSSM